MQLGGLVSEQQGLIAHKQWFFQNPHHLEANEAWAGVAEYHAQFQKVPAFVLP